MGIAAVQVSVIGAAFGSKDYNRIINAFNHTLRIAVVIESFIALITFIFAKEITLIFTWSENVSNLHNEFIIFFRTITFVLPSQTISIVCSASFAGIGKGLNALVIDAFRTCLFTFPSVLLFSVYLNIGLHGVWYGIVIGNYMTAIISVVWFIRYKEKLFRELL